MTSILNGLEKKWSEKWEEQGIYRFDRNKTRADVFSIDTPPPTVSGHLHHGNAFSYSHIDFIARFMRMRGREVFFPIGWDDNGLNTERRVQLMLGVSCDPGLPYDPDFVPPTRPGKTPIHISRPNFIEQCGRITALLEEKYRELWMNLGLSMDWQHHYTTMGSHARATSQAAFVDLFSRDLVYRSDAPTLWDVDFRTAVAQAELAERTVSGAFYRIRFTSFENASSILVDTTRPELLPACVALVAHPHDSRYRNIVGTFAQSPLFRVRIPVLAHEKADPEKGTGIAMICTFGDTVDMLWQRELQLPIRIVMERDGRLSNSPPDGIMGEKARAIYSRVSGQTSVQARTRITELLARSGDLIGDPRPIEHSVKFWENGSNPLEIITNQQWFIRYPSTEKLIARGRELAWHPDFMRIRYENWVNGLNVDWNITRQRFFGVPFPVWYPLDERGAALHDQPIIAPLDRLPVDPSTDIPAGYTEQQRNQPLGFIGDPYVMDTWATSSLTPDIAGHSINDPDLFARIFPMDLRPQAHEIIRTWLFYTIVRSEYQHAALPWQHAMISGFVTDPDRKKVSKSANNAADSPEALISEFGADAFRYWAAGAGAGQDSVLDRNRLKMGRRLAVKIANSARFVLNFEKPSQDCQVTAPLDVSMLSTLRSIVSDATSLFDEFNYKSALELIEQFFWKWCDYYLELVKDRCYRNDSSAISAARQALYTLLQLFAPIMPFITEEIWSQTNSSSIHLAQWPDPESLPANGNVSLLAEATEIIDKMRKTKGALGIRLGAPIARLEIIAPSTHLPAINVVIDDIKNAAKATEVDIYAGNTLATTIIPLDSR